MRNLLMLFVVVVLSQDVVAQELKPLSYAEFYKEIQNQKSSAPVIFHRGDEDKEVVTAFLKILQDGGWKMVGEHDTTLPYSQAEAFNKDWGVEEYELPFVRILKAGNPVSRARGAYEIPINPAAGDWIAFWKTSTGLETAEAVATTSEEIKTKSQSMDLSRLAEELQIVSVLAEQLDATLKVAREQIAALEKNKEAVNDFDSIRARLITLEKLKSESSRMAKVVSDIRRIEARIDDLISGLEMLRSHLTPLKESVAVNYKFLFTNTKSLIIGIRSSLDGVEGEAAPKKISASPN